MKRYTTRWRIEMHLIKSQQFPINEAIRPLMDRTLGSIGMYDVNLTHVVFPSNEILVVAIIIIALYDL